MPEKGPIYQNTTQNLLFSSTFPEIKMPIDLFITFSSDSFFGGLYPSAISPELIQSSIELDKSVEPTLTRGP